MRVLASVWITGWIKLLHVECMPWNGSQQFRVQEISQRDGSHCNAIVDVLERSLSALLVHNETDMIVSAITVISRNG